MRRALFILIVTALVLFSLSHYAGSYIIDDNSLQKELGRRLIFIIIVGLLLAGLALYFFAEFFPKGWQSQRAVGKIFIVVFFALTGYVVTREGMITLNCMLPSKSSEPYEATIISKRFIRGAKGVGDCYLDVLNLEELKTEKLRITKKLYDKYNNGDRLSIVFRRGPFGIRYAIDQRTPKTNR